MGSCNRVNVLRAQSNLSDTVSWKILSDAGQRELSLAVTDVPETRKAHVKSAATLLEQASTLTATGMTDCAQAVEDPLGYKQPLARPIGDPRTGKVSPRAQAVLDSSHDVIQGSATIDRAGG
jgi:hypothetical protein